jgi:hypothetical protein
MRAIDSIGDALRSTIAAFSPFGSLTPTIDAFVRAAKLKTETLRTDPEVFEVWSCFVVASETLCNFQPSLGSAAGADPQLCAQFNELLRAGSVLVSSMARARVPMPKSARAFIERCEDLSQSVKNKREQTPRPGTQPAPVLTP